MDFNISVVEVSGSMTLVVESFVEVSGHFAFKKGEVKTVTLADPNTGAAPATGPTTMSVNVTTIGADMVDIFVGNGPSKIEDPNNQGSYIDNPDAQGLLIEGAGFGMALMSPTSASVT